MFTRWDPYAEDETPVPFGMPSPHPPQGRDLVGVATPLGFGRMRWTSSGKAWVTGEDFDLPLTHFEPSTLNPVFAPTIRGAAPAHSERFPAMQELEMRDETGPRFALRGTMHSHPGAWAKPRPEFTELGAAPAATEARDDNFALRTDHPITPDSGQISDSRPAFGGHEGFHLAEDPRRSPLDRIRSSCPVFALPSPQGTGEGSADSGHRSTARATANPWVVRTSAQSYDQVATTPPGRPEKSTVVEELLVQGERKPPPDRPNRKRSTRDDDGLSLSLPERAKVAAIKAPLPKDVRGNIDAAFGSLFGGQFSKAEASRLADYMLAKANGDDLKGIYDINIRNNDPSKVYVSQRQKQAIERMIERLPRTGLGAKARSAYAGARAKGKIVVER